MNVLALVLALSNAALVFFGLRVLANRPFDAVALYLYGVGLFLVFRPLLIALELHNLWPVKVFPDPFLASDALIDAQLIVTLWIVASFAGVTMADRIHLKPLRLGGPRGFDDSQLFRASIALMALAALVTIPLWIQYGGPDGLTRAFKIEKRISPFLRLVPLIATVTASASILSRVRTNATAKTRPLRTLARFAIFAACAYMSYSWGARDAPVFGLLAILLGRLEFSRTTLSRSAQLVLAACIVGGAIVGLRVARDLAIQDEVFSSITSENLVGQISIASNITMFDAFALVVMDGPPGGDFANGRDFTVAIQSAIPLVEPTGDTRSVALQVAQEYRPLRANGWPISPVGDWYVNFGTVGALLGGFASALLVSVIRKKTREFYKDPLIYSATLFVMATFLRGGIWARSINVGWQFLTALAITIWMMRFLRLSDPSPIARSRDGDPSSRAQMERV